MFGLGIFGVIKTALGFGKSTFDYFLAKANGDTAKALELMKTYQSIVAAQRDVTIASMNHPIWWIAWALFVLPTGLYYAKCLTWDTTFGLGSTPEIRGMIADWAKVIVPSLFGLQVGTGIVAGLLNRIFK